MLEVSVDTTVLWVGAGLAIAAAVLLAYVPRLPSWNDAAGFGLASSSVRITPGTNRRLRAFATAQIAFSFVLLAAAGMLVATLIALQMANAGFDTRQVLALDMPPLATGVRGEKAVDYQEVKRRIGELPGVEGVATGAFVPGVTPVRGAARSLLLRVTPRQTEKRTRTRGRDMSRPVSLRCSGFRWLPAVTSTITIVAAAVTW